MSGIIKRSIAVLAALLIMITQMPLAASAQAPQSYYIKNDYTSGAYLCDFGGALRYAVPTAGDGRYRWSAEEIEGGLALKNEATGRYLSLEGHGTSAGSYTEPVMCSETPFAWSFSPETDQNIISANESYAGFGIHLEGADNGFAIGQLVEESQLKWGNMRWDFLSAPEINFTAPLREGVCIRNESGELLFDGGTAGFGVPDGADDRYIWYVGDRADGMLELKNKATNSCLVIDGGQPALSKEAAGIDLIVGINVTAGGSDSAWDIIASPMAGSVAGDLKLEGVYALKNCWFGMYIIDQGGTVVYGNASPADKAAHWEFLYDETTGGTAIRNAGTGRYLMWQNENAVSEEEESFCWNLLRNQSDLYPNAVVMQRTEDSASYVHMEQLTGVVQCSGAVQPTWGTPHWDPLPVGEMSGAEYTQMELADGMWRFANAATGDYLFENASGAIVYGTPAETDARSHWIAEAAEGGVLLKNRESGNYMNIATASGKLKGSANDSTVFSVKNNGDAAVISAVLDGKSQYQQPCVNIVSLSGMAMCTLEESGLAETLWSVEVAPENSVAAADDEENAGVVLNTFKDYAEYEITSKGKKLDGSYRLEHYGERVRIRPVGSDSRLLTADGGRVKNSLFAGDDDPEALWQYGERLGRVSLRNGDARLYATQISCDRTYDADTAVMLNGEMVFTVFVQEGGEYSVSVNAAQKCSADLTVNGLPAGTLELPASTKLALHTGVNTIGISGGAASSITVADCIGNSFRGASAAYTEYQAEQCETNGAVLDPSREFYDIASEASGRSGVMLDGTMQSIKFTLTRPANALVIRACVPDTEDGKGGDYTITLTVNGKRTSIPLTSRYSWIYGAYPYTNIPSNGLAHRYFDDARILLGETLEAGTVVKLSKESADTVEYCIIDMVETELVEDAYEMPEGAISITEFGAVADDGFDDTRALLDCIDAAAEQGREVFIPAGTFKFDSARMEISKSVTIRGAGMWHTVLSGEFAAFVLHADNIRFYDFSITGAAVIRRDSIDAAAFEADNAANNVKNNVIQNVWMEHHKVGLWTYKAENMLITGCRIRNTFADGINLCSGSSKCVVEQCSVRGTGDDAIAMWSQGLADDGNVIRFNTVSSPQLANCVAAYGGRNITVSDNVLRDTITNGAGINISSNFNPADFGGFVLLERNSLERCGSTDSGLSGDYGAIWFNTVASHDNNAQVVVRDNVISDSSYQGVSFGGKGAASDVTISENAIVNSGTWGVDACAGTSGSAVLVGNRISASSLGRLNNSAGETFVFTEKAQQKKGGISSDALLMIAGGVIAAIIFSIAALLTRKKKPAADAAEAKEAQPDPKAVEAEETQPDPKAVEAEGTQPDPEAAPKTEAGQ